MKQAGFFGVEDALAKLSRLGDPLEKLHFIDWEMFRPLLQQALKRDNGPKRGRPAFDCVMMFKLLVLRRLNNLGDDQMEYQVNDRLSYRRFLGLTIDDRVPDAKTIWLFRDNLSKTGAADKLFRMFVGLLEDRGLVTHEGTIVDATFVEAPRQRNTRDQNRAIKQGKVPAEWQDGTEKSRHRLPQKDVDARWAKKGGQTFYGYKDHVKVDAASKFVTDYRVSSAEVHDSRHCSEFIVDGKDRRLFADSAYSSAEIAEKLPKSVENMVHEKGYRDHPLTEAQKESNRRKSRTRARVEHVFGFMTGAMHGITVRCVGTRRARFDIGLTNLVYNMCRYSYLLGRMCRYEVA